jgi:HSP20 family molecular chaperone IbpA
MSKQFDSGETEPQSQGFGDGAYSDMLPLVPCESVGAYNFARIGKDRYCLTLAVPGFDEEDIDVSAKAGYLHVSGVATDVDSDGVVLHRGLEATLDHTFLMIHPLEVAEVEVHSGLLRITLREHPGAGVQTSAPPSLSGSEAITIAA